jgi:hypothetical protein
MNEKLERVRPRTLGHGVAHSRRNAGCGFADQIQAKRFASSQAWDNSS